jgi:hypothetical protein
MHHLMNSYRPHQARQILIEMLQKQAQQREQLLKAIDSYVIMCINIEENRWLLFHNLWLSADLFLSIMDRYEEK